MIIGEAWNDDMDRLLLILCDRDLQWFLDVASNGLLKPWHQVRMFDRCSTLLIRTLHSYSYICGLIIFSPVISRNTSSLGAFPGTWLSENFHIEALPLTKARTQKLHFLISHSLSSYNRNISTSNNLFLISAIASVAMPSLLVLLLFSSYGAAFKFLVFNPQFGNSHVNYMSRLSDALIDEGHEVVSQN